MFLRRVFFLPTVPHGAERRHPGVGNIAKPMKPNASPAEPKVRVNLEIRARQVRVIDEEGEQLGIMAPIDAMREAEQRGLDLVEVAPMGTPPVCRIMDYGKYRYEQKRRQREARKHQHTVVIKEVKYRPKISKHDLDFKNGHVREFLEQGNKVKVTVMFRGREMAHPEFGTEILLKAVESVQDITSGEVSVNNLPIEGRNMSLILAPSKSIMKRIASKATAASPSASAGDASGIAGGAAAAFAPELLEAADSVDVPELVETADAVDAPELVEVAEAVDVPELVEVADSAEVSEE